MTKSILAAVVVPAQKVTNCVTIDTFAGAHKPARADQTVYAQLAAPLRYR